MTSTVPSPQTWTLRFKNNRTTILLHIDPLQSLSSVKANLLKAVQETHPSGSINGVAISQDYSDILLARPVDVNDLALGWIGIEGNEHDGKGKGKATVKITKNSVKDCPHGVGLRDGGIVAFRFRSEEEDGSAGGVKRRVEDDDDIVVVDDEEEKGEEWEVVIPSLEEIYGDGLPGVAEMEQGEG